jgi:hypothetical protein
MSARNRGKVSGKSEFSCRFFAGRLMIVVNGAKDRPQRCKKPSKPFANACHIRLAWKKILHS